MHVLTVIAQPNPASFTHAIAGRFHDGLAKAGHSFELADLHAEGFDPRWRDEDQNQFSDKPMPDDVLREQARVERCQAICLAFPLFWYGMPAMMKGWIDRVWSWDWAYNQISQHDQSLQPDRIGVLLIPAAANPSAWQPLNLQESMETIWAKGTLGFMGLSNNRLHFLNGSEGSAERRAQLLERAELIGLELAAQKREEE